MAARAGSTDAAAAVAISVGTAEEVAVAETSVADAVVAVGSAGDAAGFKRVSWTLEAAVSSFPRYQSRWGFPFPHYQATPCCC